MDLGEFKTIEFKHKDKCYIYNFGELTVEQAELAREAGLYKYNQSQSEPTSFEQILNSNQADWLVITLSFLVKEKEGDRIKDFDRFKIKEAEQFLKTLPAKFVKIMREAIDDFFLNAEMPLSCSIVSQMKKNSEKSLKLLLSALMAMKNDKENF